MQVRKRGSETERGGKSIRGVIMRGLPLRVSGAQSHWGPSEKSMWSTSWNFPTGTASGALTGKRHSPLAECCPGTLRPSDCSGTAGGELALCTQPEVSPVVACELEGISHWELHTFREGLEAPF